MTFLKYLYSNLSYGDKILQKILIALNGQIKDLDKEEVWDNPFIKHALKVGLGEKELDIKYENISKELKESLNKLIF